MWSLSLVMSECSLSGRSQGHVSNFYIVDLENFATARRRYINTQLDRRRFVYDTWDNGRRLGHVMVECTLSITHCLRLNLQLHTISLVRTCRISSFCTFAWQLARFQLTRRIARSLGDSWAPCFTYWLTDWRHQWLTDCLSCMAFCCGSFSLLRRLCTVRDRTFYMADVNNFLLVN